MTSLSEGKVRSCFPTKCKISLLPCFWANEYDSINNFIVTFMYEDDVTLSFQMKKIQIPKILPMWVLAPLKRQQNFEVLQLVCILTPNKS